MADFEVHGYQYPKPGLNSVGSYQMSSIPFLTSSLTLNPSSGASLRIQFPYVTKWVTIRCDAAVEMRFGFSSGGVESRTNYIVLPESGSWSGDVRVTDLYLLSNSTVGTTASVIAGLTGIRRNDLAIAPMNNWSGSVLTEGI